MAAGRDMVLSDNGGRKLRPLSRTEIDRCKPPAPCPTWQQRARVSGPLFVPGLTDNAVGALQQTFRNCHSELLSDLEIDDELSSRHHLERRDRWICTFEDFVDDDRHEWISV